MSGRGGRGRFRRASRFEDNFGSRNISNKNPPSRHLWVGNLSHATLEHDLSHYFLQFGELESVAFQPGRSYAFINFKREEDAFVAINALQGFSIAGNPLRIEFTKAVSPAHPQLPFIMSVTFLGTLSFSLKYCVIRVCMYLCILLHS
ncbi:hypothetical protein I3760_04G196800 [Carya illinoinensis]|nr:hypothetical protein I3760_04G196800 [Carya illinoinensis]